MWYRGYSDGDGCFYRSNNSSNQYTISGDERQDFEFLRDKCVELGISRFKIEKPTLRSREGRISKYSLMRMSHRESIKIFGDYIYQANLHIKFDRKYDKFIEIVGT